MDTKNEKTPHSATGTARKGDVMNIEYERTKVDMGDFADLFPEGSSFFQTPKLPTIEFKAGKVKYTVTDLRVLNETAVDCFLKILNEAMNTPNCTSVSFNVTGMPKTTIDLVEDIVSAIKIEASKKGRKSFSFSGSFLTRGTSMYTTKNGEKILEFKLIEDDAKAVYEYAHENEHPSVYGAAVAIHEKTEARLAEAMKQYSESTPEDIILCGS